MLLHKGIYMANITYNHNCITNSKPTGFTYIKVYRGLTICFQRSNKKRFLFTAADEAASREFKF